MSDPEPSVAARSSSPATAQAPESAAAAALNYAFLVHSQKTLTQNLPPRVDNKLLARQKRRRTSPEDHAILESEYQLNPKPDKAARTNIVQRVSLGEKEVQIWFQNRRQNDRRKSKPLQPHELLAPRSGGTDASKNIPSDEVLPAEPGSSSGTEQSEESGSEKHSMEQLVGTDSVEADVPPAERDEAEQLGPDSQTSVESSEVPDNSQPISETTEPDPEPTQIHEAIVSEESFPSSAKRKRSISELRECQPAVQQPVTPGAVPDAKSPPSLRISLSFDGEAMVRKDTELTPSPPKGRNALRIAMSSDGKAVIRAEGEPSPSKNRVSMFSARKPRSAGLRRSNSAVVHGTPRGPAEKERLFGRSRDPRNWESFFDTDARSALSTPSSSQIAPNSGSPGMFRPGAPRSLTRSLSARHRNMLTSTPTSSEYLNTPVPNAAREKRRKISRTVSSLGRLESGHSLLNRTASGPVRQPKLLPKMAKDAGDADMHGGDSDKENWVPGTRASHIRRRAASHHQSQRPALGESKGRDGKANKDLMATGRRSRLSQASQRKVSGGKDVPEVDADVSAFMAGGGSASQEEDLDCIQGLLSLSQGAWR
ncbi:Homeobox protein yox1 [Aspergillus melleus]|uniref:Homeobox protein yox1 n=1 Tax=Aspergillus melleus TaxID=138277 RepID=A0ACC3AXL9_9EURO|nr:Homeobox protein yox1 [Aspergillus melleus]